MEVPAGLDALQHDRVAEADGLALNTNSILGHNSKPAFFAEPIIDVDHHIILDKKRERCEISKELSIATKWTCNHAYLLEHCGLAGVCPQISLGVHVEHLHNLTVD
jgi:hypothetical protein